MRVLFDINVILTALLELVKDGDSSYLSSVKELWKANAENRIEGCINAFSLAILFGQCESYYYAQFYNQQHLERRLAVQRARSKAYVDVRRCVELFTLNDLVYQDVLEAERLIAENASCNDFEDNLQLVCAHNFGIDIIVTDNVRDFGCALLFGIPVLTPSQFLKRI